MPNTQHDVIKPQCCYAEFDLCWVWFMLSVTNKPCMLSVTNESFMLSVTNKPLMLSVTNKPFMLSFTNKSCMLSVTNKPFMLSVTNKPFMLSVTNKPFKLSVIMLNVNMLSVVAPFRRYSLCLWWMVFEQTSAGYFASLKRMSNLLVLYYVCFYHRNLINT
jgi:hypothetical protein